MCPKSHTILFIFFRQLRGKDINEFMDISTIALKKQKHICVKDFRAKYYYHSYVQKYLG
jgi:hypothetical protein